MFKEPDRGRKRLAMFVRLDEVKLQFVSRYTLITHPHQAIDELINLSSNSWRVLESIGLKRPVLKRLIREKKKILLKLKNKHKEDLVQVPDMVYCHLLLAIGALEPLIAQNLMEIAVLRAEENLTAEHI